MTNKQESPWRFEAIAEAWAQSARPSNFPKTIYHYTDASGLLGILQSGKLWATDYRFLNDRAEVEHTRQIVRDVVEKVRIDCVNTALTKFYQRVLENSESTLDYSLFVFSLSEEKDDLSQWRAYAKDGQGFTVGFSTQTIYDVMVNHGSFGLRKVQYDQGHQFNELLNAINDIQEEIIRCSAFPNNDPNLLISRAAYWFHWLSMTRAALNKHGSFSSEREWRLIAFANDTDGDSKVRSAGLRLVRYGEFKFPDSKLPVTEIGIGPGFTTSETVYAVRQICRGLDYNPEIYFANTPYRRVG